MTPGPRSFPAIALAACVLGLLLSPYVYLAFPVRLESLELSLLLTLLLAPCSGFLLWRLLAKPNADRRSPALVALEVACWAVSLGVLYVVSGARLMRGLERFGAACTIFVVVSVLALPVVLLRATSLVQRLQRVPRGLATFALVSILALSGITAAYHVITPSRPIAGN